MENLKLSKSEILESNFLRDRLTRLKMFSSPPQMLFMSLAVISMYFIPSLIYKVQIFQEEMGIYFPNYQMNHAWDFLISCLLAICIHITKLYTHKQVLKHYGPILQKKYSGTNLELRLYKINASWMKFLFFTCTSIYA